MKVSTLKSIYHCKCPRCHEGDLFLRGQLLNPTKFSDMNKECSHCGQYLEPEPGFYLGAMFISYGFNTAVFIAVWVTLAIIEPDYSLTLLLTLIGVAILVLTPFIYRISRSMWIAFFVPFRGKDLPSSN